MTGPGAGSPGDPGKRADLGGADAVPDTPSTAKRQGSEPGAPKSAAHLDAERRLTPRAATATASTGGMKPVIWIVIAIVAIAAAYFAFGM